MFNYIKPNMLNTIVKIILVEAYRSYLLLNSLFGSDMFQTLFSINYISYPDVFNLLRWGFICFWCSVVFYNVYKSILNVSIADQIASLMTPRNMPTGKVTFSILLLSLIGYIYRRQLYILLDVLDMDGNILYRFLAYIAVWGSFIYLRYFIKQLSNPGKRDFSLTSPYMQNALSLSKFFTYACWLCIHEILRYFK